MDMRNVKFEDDDDFDGFICLEPYQGRGQVENCRSHSTA